MAVLPDSDRTAIHAAVMREISKVGESLGLSKADLRAAINAMDAWANDNAAAFNASIPQPARGALTTAQKARLFSAVIRRRYEVGS